MRHKKYQVWTNYGQYEGWKVVETNSKKEAQRLSCVHHCGFEIIVTKIIKLKLNEE